MATTAKKKVAAASVSKTVTITQVGSASGHTVRQIATLKGLGLRGRHSSRTLQDTPEVRGMIAKVKHLVTVADDRG